MSDDKPQSSGILRDRNFLIYWAGTAVSLIGDAISMIALPWLILQMTDDPRRLGIVLAVQALPRALFMLFGGAAADKYSPRKVLLASRGISIFVIGALGLLVVDGLMKVWMIYPFALVLGTIGAFHLPAATSIIPTLVSSDHLRAANSAFNGTAQLSMLAGPALAGLLIVLFSGEGAAGIGYAFLVDASTFVIGTISLAFVTARKSGAPEHHRTIGERLRSGIAYALADAGIRGILLFIVAANFFIIGVMVVGLPVFADQALDLGAEGFGYLMSAIGGGSLLGTVLAGVLPSPPIGRRGLVLFPLSAGSGLMLGACHSRGRCRWPWGLSLSPEYLRDSLIFISSPGCKNALTAP